MNPNDWSKADEREAQAAQEAVLAAAEWAPLADLLPWKRNPRLNDGAPVERVAASIRRFGFTAPVVAWRSKRQIVAGHTRVKAMQTILAAEPSFVPGGCPGVGVVPVRFVEFASQGEADAYALADNRLTEATPWSDDLADVLRGLDEDGVDISTLGWGEDDLAALLGGDEDPALDGDTVGDDDVPDAPEVPMSRPGEVYELGPHRLMCGDCREPGVVARLLDGRKINLAFTSPPYASQRKYDETSGFKPIPPDEYVAWFEAVQAAVRENLAADGSWFVNIKPASDGLDTELYVLDLVIAHARLWGWHFAAEFCWERTGIPGKPARRFKNQFEPVYQFAVNEWKFRPQDVRHESASAFEYEAGKGKSLKENQGGVGEEWFSGRSGEGVAYPGNRLPTFSGSHEATGHSAAYPAGLPSFFIRAYTDPDDAVFDPFMGSGTTLVASAKHGRVAFGTEISPAYCDVIRRRWTRWAVKNGQEPGAGALEDL